MLDAKKVRRVAHDKRLKAALLSREGVRDMKARLRDGVRPLVLAFVDREAAETS